MPERLTSIFTISCSIVSNSNASIVKFLLGLVSLLHIHWILGVTPSLSMYPSMSNGSWSLAFLEIRQTLYCFTFVPPKFHHPLFSFGLKHMLPCMFYVMFYVPSHMQIIFVYLDGTKNSPDFSLHASSCPKVERILPGLLTYALHLGVC